MSQETVSPEITEGIEFFTQESLGPRCAAVRCRLVIGYVLAHGDLYHMEKKGGIIELSADETSGGNWPAMIASAQQRLLEYAQRTWDQIPETGEITEPVYAWQLGAPYEEDDDGEIMGEWPVVGTLTLRYTAKFLMPGGRLPDGYQHLRPRRVVNYGTYA